VKVFSLIGKEILSKKLSNQSTKLNMKKIPKGIYILSVYNGLDKLIKTTKIIVLR